MGRPSVVIALPACLVAFAAVAGGAACESTLNLGNEGDGSTEAAADCALPTCESTCVRLIDTCHLFATDQRGACLSECTKQGDQSELNCVALTPCESIARNCGNGRGDGSSGPVDGSVV